MKTTIVTKAVVGLALIVVFASCTTTRSYPDTRRYPTHYPNERVIVVREHPRAYGHYRRPVPRRNIYVQPRRSAPQYRYKKNNGQYRKDMNGRYNNGNYYKGKTQRKSRN